MEGAQLGLVWELHELVKPGTRNKEMETGDNGRNCISSKYSATARRDDD